MKLYAQAPEDGDVPEEIVRAVLALDPAGRVVDRIAADRLGHPRVLDLHHGWWERTDPVWSGSGATPLAPLVGLKTWLPVRAERGPTVPEVLVTLPEVFPEIVRAIDVVEVIHQRQVTPTAANGHIERWVLCHVVLYRHPHALTYEPTSPLQMSFEEVLCISGTRETDRWDVVVRRSRAFDQASYVSSLRRWSDDEWLSVLATLGLADVGAARRPVSGRLTIWDGNDCCASDVAASARDWVLGQRWKGMREALFAHVDGRFDGVGAPPEGSSFTAIMVLMPEDEPVS